MTNKDKLAAAMALKRWFMSQEFKDVGESAEIFCWLMSAQIVLTIAEKHPDAEVSEVPALVREVDEGIGKMADMMKILMQGAWYGMMVGTKDGTLK